MKKILKESSGISFEVREWAKIIEKYVKDILDKNKSTQKPIEYNTDFFNYDTVRNDDGFSYLDDFETEQTHFESHGGDIYYEAFIYGEDLWVNNYVLKELPNIKNLIKGKLFKVELEDGYFTFDVVKFDLPHNYFYGVLEVILDNLNMGTSFHTEDYEEVFPVTYDDTQNNGVVYEQQPSSNIINKIEIKGSDFPEAYDKFKVDLWVINNSNRIEYDHRKSGYNDDGQYIVYLNMPMYSVRGSSLIHEIKHAYDDWNRISRGGKPIRDSWEVRNIYTEDFEKLVLNSNQISSQIANIVKLYYMGSKLESPAYLENEYDSGSYRSIVLSLIRFKKSNIDHKKLQKDWEFVINNFNIPFFKKFKDFGDFLTYTEKYFNKRGRQILKKIDKMNYKYNKERNYGKFDYNRI